MGSGLLVFVVWLMYLLFGFVVLVLLGLVDRLCWLVVYVFDVCGVICCLCLCFCGFICVICFVLMIWCFV